ncbi:xylulokinase [Enterococcus sp. PF1-24]|uniref:xylulokinase n=1 Tax=unclassified Enterococcus TaxID=2608891 RepID=UPI0024758E88|nr:MULTISPECIES: FGGY family carbohydrate kinase [unclassified Enterococcus]MDH6365406.1 xylulokinase [Enterococcus sp. PFB1-1]MDH6402522.1 xylulokinase [Enterococcus sp. PF1-24]
MKKIYVGLDIGTTAIKIAAVDRNLNLSYEKQYHYDYLTPYKGWTEINPDIWVEIVLKGLKELLQHIPVNTIAGIGVTGQMHTTVFVDKHGFSVRPAIMWNDNRTKELIPEIKQILLTEEKTAHIAKIVSTGSPLANLLWLKEFEPKNYEKMKKFLIAKDYVILKLTQTYSTDYCDASVSSLYDLNEDTWSESVKQLFGLESTLFPVINHSSKIAGELSKLVQVELGINENIPVVAGTGDNVASALASGSFIHDQPLISLGTSGVVVIPNRFHKLKEVGKNVVAKIREDDNTIITQGTIQAGAKVNSWWLENIICTTDFSKAQTKISSSLLGNNDVLFFPHLNGEKTLFANPNLRGAFVGLGLETTQEEMYLAVLEGLAFGIRNLYEKMKNEENPKYFTIVGGGAKSVLWIQLFANILNYPIKRIFDAREAVHGAASLAIIGIEENFDFPERNFQIIEPDKKCVSEYEKKYVRYLELTETMLTYTKAVKNK